MNLKLGSLFNQESIGLLSRDNLFSDDLYQIASPDGGARLLFAEVDFGYGDLTAVYGRDGKKLRGFAYRNHIMVEHNQPDGLVSRYEYDRYDTDGKVLKSSNNLGEEWTFDYRKGHTVVTDALGRTEVYGFDENRELVYRIDAEGQRTRRLRPHYRRMRPRRTQNPPINPLLPLRPNWYP